MVKKKKKQDAPRFNYEQWSREVGEKGVKEAWRERKYEKKITRETHRHLKAIEPFMFEFGKCSTCPSREWCVVLCPAAEASLFASGRSTEGLRTDQMITQSDWRPSSQFCDADDGIDEGEFFENYASLRPLLSDVIGDRYQSNRDIVQALLDGKLTFESIAEENYCTLAQVRAIRDAIVRILGLDAAVPTEDQKIILAIIDDRLRGVDAARIFSKDEEDISRRKRRARERIVAELAETEGDRPEC